jgi:hypothetical protein
VLTQYYLGDQIEKNERVGSCSTYGGEERYKGFWRRNPRERDNLEDPGVDGSIILR